jgi:hypothetical protein
MGVLRRRSRGFLMAAGLVGSSILVAACGDAREVPAIVPLERAANMTAATGLKMDISLNESVGGPSVVFNATGSFTPKKDQGTMMMSMLAPADGGSTAPMQVVISGGTIYERLPPPLASRIPGGKPWLSVKLSQLNTLNQLPGLNAFIKESLTFDDPSQYLDFLSAAAAGSVKKLGYATVNGVQTTRYLTTIPVSKLPSSIPSMDRQAAAQLVLVLKSRLHATAMPVDVYVDRANLIRRLQTTLRGEFAGHPVSLAITENITRYGSQPAPAAPSPASTTDLLSLVQAFPPSSG